MTLYVYNQELERVGVVESIISLQWLSEHQDTGEAKLVCSVNEKSKQLLIDGNRLYCTEQSECAVIAEVEIADSGDDAVFTVRAPFSAERWKDRVVMATEIITNVEAGALALTTKNRRGLHGLTAAAKGLGATTDTQITWGSVLDAEKTLCKSAALGFREVFDAVSACETFEVYRGTDRTSGDNYNGYFGDDIGNLSNIKIISGSATWKNVAIVGGEGEGAGRKIVTVSIGAYTGECRRELWVDAKDISKTYQIATPDGNGGYTYSDGTYTDAEYTLLLQARGLEKLSECLKTLSVAATLGQEVMTYGIDYFIGDVVPVKITKYGLRLSARISAVRTIYESTGKKVEAVLSDFNITEEVSL